MIVLYKSRLLGVLAVSLAVAALFVLTGGAGAEQDSVLSVSMPGDPDYQTIIIPVVEDTTLKSWFANNNYASDQNMALRSGDVSSVILGFDVSPILGQEDWGVAQAKLKVYIGSRTSPVSMLVSACAVKRLWVADEATWNKAAALTRWEQPGCNGPNDREMSCSVPAEFSGAGEWAYIDVTEIVDSWKRGVLPNNGLILKSDSGGSVSYSLASVEHRDVSLRPVLEVALAALPTPEPSLTPTNTPTPPPAVGIKKTGPSGPLYVGQYEIITYHIEVRNEGIIDLSGVVITDSLPLGTEFLDCTGGGVYDSHDTDSGLVIWQIESLPVGVTHTVSLDLGLPTWVKERGNIVNLVRSNCTECTVIRENYWEIPVLLPTIPPETPTRIPTIPTLTPTPTATISTPTHTATAPTPTPTATSPTPQLLMYFPEVHKLSRFGRFMYLPSLYN